MHIAMFTETYLPHANGVTTSVANARTELTKRGHQVTVFSAGNRRQSGAGVHYYGGYALTRYPDFPLAIYPTLARPSSRQIVRDQDVQVGHLHGPGPMGFRGYRACRSGGIPYVFTYHTLIEPLATYAPLGLRRMVARFARNVQGYLARHASRFIVPSRFLERTVLAEQPELDGRCVVVPSGVDIDRFRPDVDGAPARASWGFDEDDEVLIYLGRLGFEKRIGFLLDSFASLREARPSAKLVLAGTGPGQEAFRRQARGLGLDDAVRFTGYVPDAQVPGFYRAADAFVSASDFETQGLTLLEAMATGIPSAVAAAGGYLDVLRPGENAYAFEPNRRESAVAAMDAALDAPQSMRTAARRTALEYSLAKCVERLETTYEDVMSSRAS